MKNLSARFAHAVRPAIAVCVLQAAAGVMAGQGGAVLQEIRSRAQAGDARAQYELGERYNKGTGVPMDRDAALRLFTAAALQREPRSEYELARYYSGHTGQAFDQVKSLAYLQSAAEHGHRKAQDDLAFAYLNGSEKLARDLDLSYRWFSRAMAGGSVIARCMLADFYKNGWGNAGRDERKAVAFYKATAVGKEGCAPRSQYQLYLAYAAGQGVRKDLPTAISWLKRSASNGNVVAQAALGRAYLKGEGVSQDDARGRAWLKKSREGVAPHEDEDHDHQEHAALLFHMRSTNHVLDMKVET